MRCYSKRKKPKHWSKPKWKKHCLTHRAIEIFFLFSRVMKDKYKENDYYCLFNNKPQIKKELKDSDPLDPKWKFYIIADGKAHLFDGIKNFNE